MKRIKILISIVMTITTILTTAVVSFALDKTDLKLVEQIEVKLDDGGVARIKRYQSEPRIHISESSSNRVKRSFDTLESDYEDDVEFYNIMNEHICTVQSSGTIVYSYVNKFVEFVNPKAKLIEKSTNKTIKVGKAKVSGNRKSLATCTYNISGGYTAKLITKANYNGTVTSQAR